MSSPPSKRRTRASAAPRQTARIGGARRAIPRRLESAAARQARAGRILAVLQSHYPDAHCALNHRTPLELLAATILSAQCTDQRVNLVTPTLFSRYRSAADFAAADPAELEELIRSTGFFRNKARSLIGMGRVLCDEFGGRVPQTMAELLRLPGVARKTANCVLGTSFGKAEGVVVDTHVGRIAMRLALAPTARDDKDAVRIENDLMSLFPRDSWTFLSHAMIDHGRSTCSARKPACDRCPLRSDCPSAESITTR
ncbi:MAG: endonuclease III [Phycisphaerales bacterium]|nr:endonuclease III [Phycisphaerales bacterium]